MDIKLGDTVYLVGKKLFGLGLEYPIKAKVTNVNSDSIEVKTGQIEYKPVIDEERGLYMHGTECFIFTNVKEKDIIRGI